MCSVPLTKSCQIVKLKFLHIIYPLSQTTVVVMQKHDTTTMYCSRVYNIIHHFLCVCVCVCVCFASPQPLKSFFIFIFLMHITFLHHICVMFMMLENRKNGV